MRYEWKCCECGESIEVDRRLAEYQRPPDETEHDCESQEFRRVISKPGGIVIWEI